MTINRNYISIKLSASKFKERNKELSMLLDMSNFLSASMSVKDLLSGALNKILKFFNLEAGRIYFKGNGKRYLQLVAYLGLDIEGLEKVDIKSSFSGKAFRTKSFIAQHVSELEEKKRSSLLINQGFKIVICVPLIALDDVMGVMNLTTKRRIELDQGKIDLLTAIGNQIAVAFNNTRLYEAYEHKIKMLKERNEMIKFFAYTISHDLKSPATGIYGLSKRLQDKYGQILNEKGRATCSQILKTAEQMVSLVENINAYIVTNEAPLNMEKVNVKAFTRTVREDFSHELERRGIRWSEPDTFPTIIADRLALSRVFRNLLDNALKYGGGELFEIKIGYEENSTHHILSFCDNGVGITDGDKHKIFEMFQRNETSKGIPGSGLGLTIVKEIAQRHGGCAWVKGTGKTGTTFCISISKNLNNV
ncbi:MAG: ATP-binding protein [Pseudomonadota bacterium]